MHHPGQIPRVGAGATPRVHRTGSVVSTTWQPALLRLSTKIKDNCHNPSPKSLIGVTNGHFQGSGALGWYSFHPGGINVVLADGSVRFVSNNIKPTTLMAAI